MKGLAEPIRLLLAVADIPFEDNRITHEQIAEIKSTLPFGTVPYVEFDG